MPAPLPFGRYLLLDRIAIGGMAELFLAKAVGDGGFEKVCVIKRVLPHLAANESFVQMFLDEARIAARLEHPGIAQIFDLGKQGDAYYLAMEYLPGEDAASIFEESRKQGRPVPVEVACAIIAAAAEALDHAHQMRGPDGKPLGIVHRDVSPANLFVTYRGQVKLLDFGIAHAEARLAQTQTGEIKGKSGYMGPEQSKGLPVDRRADVWALGVCLHELLSGKRLFASASPADNVINVLKGEVPSLAAQRPEVPERLEVIVRRCLAVDPNDRYQTALELAHELRDLCGAGPRLDTWLRELFGAEKAEAKLARATLPPKPASASTQPQEELLGRQAPADPAALKTLEEPRPPRRWRLPLLGGAAVLALVGAGLWLRPSARVAPPPPPAGATSYEAKLRSVPADAAIYLDGELLKDRTPATLTKLAAGSSSVRLEKPGFKTRRAQLDVGPGKERVELELTLEVDPEQVSVGSLRITSEPPGATVFLDGRQQAAPTPTLIPEVSATDEHLVTLESAGREPFVEKITLAPGELGVVAGALLAPAPALYRGELKVTSRPAGAVVLVDGSAAGKTPSLLKLSPGRHLVRLAAVEYRPEDRWVTLGPGQRQKLALNLERAEPPASLGVEANVAGEVWLDGVKLGALPLAPTKVPAGRHLLQVEGPAESVRRLIRLDLRPGSALQKKLSFGRGTLNVAVTPSAEVFLDEISLGPAPVSGLQVWEGRHLLRLAGARASKTLSLDIPAGEQVRVNEAFTP